MLNQPLGGTPATSSLLFPLHNICWSLAQKSVPRRAALDWQQSTSAYQKLVTNELDQDASSRTEETRGHSSLPLAGQFQFFAARLRNADRKGGEYFVYQWCGMRQKEHLLLCSIIWSLCNLATEKQKKTNNSWTNTFDKSLQNLCVKLGLAIHLQQYNFTRHLHKKILYWARNIFSVSTTPLQSI